MSSSPTAPLSPSSPPPTMSPALFLAALALSLSLSLSAAAPDGPTSLRRAATEFFRRQPPSIHEFLQAHNKVRQTFKLPLLTWDKALSRYAKRLGKRRKYDCKMIHSYGPYGENLFWGKKGHWTPTEVVESWAGENRNYDLSSNVCAAGQLCGHYTQIIWKESLRLGCARVRCFNGELLVICEYDPPGNYVDERPI